MKIERISDNQIRCTLYKEDLDEKGILISELAYGTEKSKELFRDLMEQASEEVGFEVDETPLMIEAIPLGRDCLVLVITKVENPDELDTRFSRFTRLGGKKDSDDDSDDDLDDDFDDEFSDLDDDLDDDDDLGDDLNNNSNKAGNKGKSNNNSDSDSDVNSDVESFNPLSILDALSKMAKARNNNSNNSNKNADKDSGNNPFGGTPFGKAANNSGMNKPANNSAKTNQTDDKNSKNSKNNNADDVELESFVFMFETLNDVATVSRLIASIYDGENSLYKSPTESGSRYYLYLEESDKLNKVQMNRVMNLIGEYGSRVRNMYATHAFYEEHYKAIIKYDAVQVLAEL